MSNPARLAALASLLLGCASTAPIDPLGTADPSAEPLPGFALMDVNATSPTFDEQVATDGLRGRVGAWYFGHAT